MKMRIAAIAALTLTAGLVLSGCAGDAPAPADSPRQSPSPSVSADASEANDADKMFAAMMIPHHQGAIDMAKVQLQYGKDPRLRRLAQGIIVEQAQEIAVMQQILDEAPATHPQGHPQ